MLEHSSRQIRTAVKWSAITEIMSKLVSPISNAILARLLTPDAFGCIATVSMVISFAEMFADAGFQKYLIQRDFASETEKDEATTVAFWTNLSVSVFLCIMIILFRESIARMVGSPDLGVAIGVSSTTILLTSFSSIHPDPDEHPSIPLPLSHRGQPPV